MKPRRPHSAATASPKPSPTDSSRADDPTSELFASYAHAERHASRGLRWSLAVAVVLHAALLFITFPNLYADRPVEDGKEQRVFVMKPPPRFKLPDEPVQVPPRPVKRIPVPSPNPDAPEIVERTVPIPEIEVAAFDDDILDLPTAPPPLEPEGPITVGGAIPPPTRLVYHQPTYTELGRKMRLQGAVILETIIDTAGNVTEIKVLKGLGAGLSDEAVDAVSRWKFEPSILGGKPVAVRYVVTVHFQLR